MKKFILSFSLVLVLALVFTGSAAAELPGGGWWSALFIQNIGADGGSVNMTAYDNDSDTEFPSSQFSFNYGRALVYDPGKNTDYPNGPYIGFDTDLPDGFEGSVVLSAGVEVAAISEIANYSNGSAGGDGTASARYQGMSTANVSTDLMVPTIKNNYRQHTTTLYVQAAGAAANVTVTYNMNDGNIYSQTQNIAENKMFVFDPSNAGVPSNCAYDIDSNTSACYGSAEIVSTTGDIAATVIEHPHSGSPAGFALSTRAQTDSDQDTKLYHPTIKNDYYDQMIAGASVMNVGSADAYVQITLTVTNTDPYSTAKVGEVYTDTAIIEPGKSVLFSKWLDNFGGMPAGTFAAAVIESVNKTVGGVTYTKQDLVGATNDSKQLPNIPGESGITLYAGFADSTTTGALAAPIIRENFGGITGGLTVQNVGSTSAKICFEYYPYGADDVTDVYKFCTTRNINPGEAVNTNQISGETSGDYYGFTIVSGFTKFSELNGKQFSVIATSGQPIIALASEYASAENQDMRNYEAFNF